MRVRIHYEYFPNGTRSAEITGDIAEWRAALQELGILERPDPEPGSVGASTFRELRSLYNATAEQFPVLETRSTSRVSVRDRRPLDRRERLAEHAAEIAGHNQRADEAFTTFLRYGIEFVDEEFRSLGVGTDSAGGFLAPQRFSDRLYMMQKAYDPLFNPDVVTVVETEPGSSFSAPLQEDTSSVWTIISENAGAVLANVGAFDILVLPKPPTFRSPMVQVSLELLQDSAYDIETLLLNDFAPESARGIGASLFGTLIAASSLGVTGAAGAISSDNIFDLVGSLDPAYTASPKCAWLCRYSTLIAIAKLKDSAGLPVFPTIMNRDANGNFSLLGMPLYVCPSAAAISTGNKSLICGDMSKYIVRRVRGSVIVKRFAETYAERAMAGFMGFVRLNSGLAKATGSDSPVKYLQHA
jgi:HK97 family phage major capsid protein